MTGRLRTLLTIDGAMCLASGAVAVVGAGPIADLLGVESSGAVRAVGLFLLVYGLDLLLLARWRGTLAERGAAATAVGDALWVASTIVLVASGAFSGGGVLVMLAMAVPVAALGITKTASLRERAVASAA